MSHMTVGEVARRLGVTAPDVSGLFYRGLVDGDRAPIQSGRRMIPEELLFVIEMALRRQGKLPPLQRTEPANVQ